jgi:spore coat polysaccharide biosynthesis protein SpsF (cytidylyltransferase family)
VEAGRWTIREHLDSGAPFTAYVAEGRGVEVFTRECLENSAAWTSRNTPLYREHPDEYVLKFGKPNFVKFSVDTMADLEKARGRIGGTETPRGTLERILPAPR